MVNKLPKTECFFMRKRNSAATVNYPTDSFVFITQLHRWCSLDVLCAIFQYHSGCGSSMGWGRQKAMNVLLCSIHIHSSSYGLPMPPLSPCCRVHLRARAALPQHHRKEIETSTIWCMTREVFYTHYKKKVAEYWSVTLQAAGGSDMECCPMWRGEK